MSTPKEDPNPAPFNTFTKCVFTLGLPATLAGLTYMSPPTAALTPLLLSPVALAAYWRSRLPATETGDVNRAVRVFAFNAALGPALAGAIQFSGGFVLTKLLFGARAKAYIDEIFRSSVTALSPELLATRAGMARDPRWIVFLAVFSYMLAGLVEEGMKYLSMRLALVQSPAKHERDYFTYAIAAALGFAACENVGMVYAAVESGEAVSMVALTAVERTVFGVAGHCATAAFIAARSVRRDVRGEKMSIWQVLSKATLYHGTFNLLLFGVCAYNGHVGWVRPKDLWSNVAMYTMGIGLQGLSVWTCWREVKSLRLRPCKASE